MTDIKVNPPPQTSKQPRPGSSLKGDRVPSLWAKESCSLLHTIYEELRELKKEVLHVKEKLNTVNKPELYELRGALIQIQRKIDARRVNPPIIPLKPSEVPLSPVSEPVPHVAADAVDVDMEEPASHSALQSPPPHAEYMENCFRSRTNLDPTTRTEVTISTFDGVIVAKGYNRVVTTYQGFFVEMERDDIYFNHLINNDYPDDGEESWVSRGLKVFSLTQPDNRHRPRAHRFAVNPPSSHSGPCNPLSTTKWYLHAYQARFLVGNTSRSLNSRLMASALRQRYPDNYHPRGKDTQLLDNSHSGWNHRGTQATGPGLPVPVENTNHQPQSTVPIIRPQTRHTQIMPLPQNNQPFLPPSIMIPATYTRPSALLPTPWPKGNAHHQRPVPPPAVPHHFPAAYNQAYHHPSSYPAPVLPVHAAHHQYPSTTYAQAANLPYYQASSRPLANS